MQECLYAFHLKRSKLASFFSSHQSTPNIHRKSSDYCSRGKRGKGTSQCLLWVNMYFETM